MDGVRAGLIGGGALTLAFLAGQLLAWRQLTAAGYLVAANRRETAHAVLTQLGHPDPAKKVREIQLQHADRSSAQEFAPRGTFAGVTLTARNNEHDKFLPVSSYKETLCC